MASGNGPGLEARVHDPELGTVRVTVTGPADQPVRAELVVADARTAAALARVADDPSVARSLAGIQLHIRVESTQVAASAMASGLGGSHDPARDSRGGQGQPNDGSTWTQAQPQGQGLPSNSHAGGQPDSRTRQGQDAPPPANTPGTPRQQPGFGPTTTADPSPASRRWLDVRA